MPGVEHKLPESKQWKPPRCVVMPSNKTFRVSSLPSFLPLKRELTRRSQTKQKLAKKAKQNR